MCYELVNLCRARQCVVFVVTEVVTGHQGVKCKDVVVCRVTGIVCI